MADLTHQESPFHVDEQALGARLKFIREQNGLSQRELAKRAGVPHSSISMIEQGQSSPSINSLSKILSGIPMSLAHFFACDISLMTQHIYRAVDLLANQQMVAKGVLSQKIPLYNHDATVGFNRITYAVGADTGYLPQRLKKGMSGFVVKGHLELTANAEVSVLTLGDAFSLSALQPHRLRNPSATEECVVLICEF